MNVRDLVPWVNRPERSQQALETRAGEPSLFTFHREMDRLFDDMLQGFAGPGFPSRRPGWPQVEVEETESEYRIHAELPGLDEKDVEVLMQDGVLVIRGEKRAETEDRHRAFSERVYGRFAAPVIGGCRRGSDAGPRQQGCAHRVRTEVQ